MECHDLGEEGEKSEDPGAAKDNQHESAAPKIREHLRSMELATEKQGLVLDFIGQLKRNLDPF